MAEKAGPPTENTSLVGGKGGPEDEKTPAEKMQTAGSIVFLVAVAVLKTQCVCALEPRYVVVLAGRLCSEDAAV
jgi:hypothetical protein